MMVSIRKQSSVTDQHAVNETSTGTGTGAGTGTGHATASTANTTSTSDMKNAIISDENGTINLLNLHQWKYPQLLLRISSSDYNESTFITSILSNTITHSNQIL